MGMQGSAHIVWDWNGTLFHDNDAIIGATNAAFAELGLTPITMEEYRALYCVPVPKFYGTTGRHRRRRRGITLASGGHPPALLLRADGSADHVHT
ncbi:HAD family hydrolase, partial [Streptomyces prunicolor]|uniref:HAD family hydrolase n=1 Tax=Streptomyces prunicolor TaxID=67348 RepID=UPI00346C9AC9